MANNRFRTTFRSGPEDHRRLRFAAEALDSSTSELCRLALRDLLNALEQQKLITSSRRSCPPH